MVVVGMVVEMAMVGTDRRCHYRTWVAVVRMAVMEMATWEMAMVGTDRKCHYRT